MKELRESRGLIDIRSGGISRRHFLTAGVASAATIALHGFSRDLAIAQETPRRGGTFRLAFIGSPAKVDPPITVSSEDRNFTRAVYENLTGTDERYAPLPQLAESWETSKDAKTWIFHLRRGVRFHHGREMDGEDVVYTWRRLLDPKTASPGRATFAMVQAVEKVDNYTVRFVLNSPYAELAGVIGANTHSLIIPHDRPDLPKNPSGTGPFKVKEFLPGDHSTFVRNDAYWRPGQPYLDEIRHVYIPTEGTQVAALLAGTLEMMWFPSPESYPILEANPEIRLLSMPSPHYQPIVMRLGENSPFNDNRLRLAFKYCVDREGMNKVVMRGRGIVANDHPVPKGNLFWVDTGLQSRDIDKAKQLLADAGYKAGLDLDLYALTGRAGVVEQALAFQDMAKPAGIRIQVRILPPDIYWAQYWMKVPFFCSNWPGRHLDELLYGTYYSTSKWNESNWKDPRVDQLLDATRSELDLQKRKAHYAALQKLFVEEGPVIIAYHRPYITAVRKNVKGFQPHPSGATDLGATWLG